MYNLNLCLATMLYFHAENSITISKYILEVIEQFSSQLILKLVFALHYMRFISIINFRPGFLRSHGIRPDKLEGTLFSLVRMSQNHNFLE